MVVVRGKEGMMYQGGFHGAPRGEFSGDLRKRKDGGQGGRDPNTIDMDRGGR